LNAERDTPSTQVRSGGQEYPPSVYSWLKTGADGLEAMLAAIAAAESTVRLETYIFVDGPIGRRFLETLIAARKRGVRVQVLIDALGSITLSSAFWAPLQQIGGEFRWFNTFNAGEHYGCRDHRKLLVIDGTHAIIGGFNIGEEYHGDGVTEGWRDLGMEVRGELATALADTFDEMFAQAASRPRPFPQLRRSLDTIVRGNSWILLLSGPGRGHRALKRTLVRDLARAERVQIICAYFVPTWKLRRALMRVARRGGQVQLILSGKSDVTAAQFASRSLYAKLMRAGVEIYEYQPQILHAKLFIVDDAAYVGSANLDARSLNINFELLARVSDCTAAAEARQVFENDLKHCRRIDPETWHASRGLWTRMLERISYWVLARIDPYLTSIRWQKRTREALEKLDS
jgi:cardiolipin synthase